MRQILDQSAVQREAAPEEQEGGEKADLKKAIREREIVRAKSELTSSLLHTLMTLLSALIILPLSSWAPPPLNQSTVLMGSP